MEQRQAMDHVIEECIVVDVWIYTLASADSDSACFSTTEQKSKTSANVGQQRIALQQPLAGVSSLFQSWDPCFCESCHEHSHTPASTPTSAITTACLETPSRSSLAPRVSAHKASTAIDKPTVVLELNKWVSASHRFPGIS